MKTDTIWSGARVRRLRLRHGWTQQRMAEWLHISKSEVSLLESGKRTVRGPVMCLLVYLEKCRKKNPKALADC